MNRAYITHADVICSLGDSLAEVFSALELGMSGIRELGPELASKHGAAQYAAPCGLDFECNKPDKDLPFNFQCVSALDELLRKLVKLNEIVEIDGVVCAFHPQQIIHVLPYVRASLPISSRNFNYSEVIFNLLQKYGVKIPAENIIFIDSACASGHEAIGLAAGRIRLGRWRRALVFSADFTDFNRLDTLARLGALNTSAKSITDASVPFSRNRAGFVKGSGAALLMLEGLKEANSESGFEIAGYSFTTDAFSITEGHPEGREARRAVEAALEDARISYKDVTFVKAHGTSTKLNDKVEAKVLKDVFRERITEIPVLSLKSQIGHTLTACGVVETAICTEMLDRGVLIPMTSNIQSDEELNLVLRQPLRGKFENCLMNSFGFGGYNSCIVLKNRTTT